MINTYINTINLNILNSPIFGNRKGYCKAVKTAPPHLTLSAWCGVLACNILFVAEFFCLYIFLHFCVEKYGRFFHKGSQINFPTRLFSKEFVLEEALKAYDGTSESINLIATKYSYSERTIRKLLKNHLNSI